MFDEANNPNLESNLLILKYASSFPSVQLISPLSDGVSKQPQMDFQLIFSEVVTGLGVRDIAVQGGSATDLQLMPNSDMVYSFSVRATGKSVRVFLPLDVVKSFATARPNQASNIVNVRFDSDPPLATVTADPESHNKKV